MKRWVWISVAVLLVLGAAFAWFWRLGSVPVEAATQVTLRVERVPVSVRRAGTDTDQDAVDGMALVAGDRVKTGSGGRATIVFFRQAESRLDANSEVTISDAAQDPNDPTDLSVRLKLEAGRVWSRVLRLFDLDSRFSVETSSVVATVRGTAFDLRKNTDGTTAVTVADAAVTVVPSSVGRIRTDLPDEIAELRNDENGESATSTEPVVTSGATAVIAAGMRGVFSAAGVFLEGQDVTPEERGSRWFSENVTADEVFVRQERERRRQELSRLGGARPDQAGAGLTRLSEQLHLALASGEEKDDLTTIYATRRLARLVELAEAGKTGLASQEFVRLENDLRLRLQGEAGEGERRALKIAIARVILLLEDAPPGSGVYPLKQRLEDLFVELQEGDRAAELFTRLLAVDARLDEAVSLLNDGALEGARTALDASRGGIQNVSRDANPVLPTLSDARRNALVEKVLAAYARETDARRRLQAALAARSAPTDSATSTTEDGATTPTTTVPPVTLPSATPGTALYDRITFAIQPNPILVGGVADLRVTGVRADGSTADVSGRATFRTISGVATLNGPQLTGASVGPVTLEATLDDNGTLRTARATLDVQAAVTLTGVNVSADRTSLNIGQAATFTATAQYSNGFTKDVTSLVVWQSSDPIMGSIAGNTITALPATRTAGATTLTIQTSYTDGGVTQTGSMSVYLTGK